MYCVHVHCTICTYSTVHMYILVLKILRSLKKSVLRMCNFKPNSIVYIEESFASK